MSELFGSARWRHLPWRVLSYGIELEPFRCAPERERVRAELGIAPDAVVLDEMVQLAKEFSTDESPSFVNGLLGRFKDLKPSLRREEA